MDNKVFGNTWADPWAISALDFLNALQRNIYFFINSTVTSIMTKRICQKNKASYPYFGLFSLLSQRGAMYLQEKILFMAYYVSD